MSDISELYNKDLEVDISATSDDYIFQISPKFIEKTPPILNETSKSKHPKPKKLQVREIIKKNKNFSEIFQTLQKTNTCFSDVITTVTCYRPELGNTLGKIHATYNKLFELVLECTISAISSKETEIESIQKKHEHFIDTVIESREDIQAKYIKQKELINVLKTRLKISTTSEEALQYEIKQLRDILKYDQNSTAQLRSNLERGRQEGDEEQAENQDVKAVHEEPGLKLKLEEQEKVIQEIESGHATNTTTLKEMRGVLRSMAMSSTNKVNWTQTEEGELYWNLDPGSIVPVPTNPASYYCLIKDVEGSSMSMTRPKVTDGLKWSLTPNIMRFLANSPSRMALPYPYAFFKKLLMEICIERLSINPEISGYMQPLLALDEFLCVFFLKRHQLRRLAEIKLKEFLGSLKFYMKWQRAAVFSKVSGIAVDVLENSEYLYTDYHTQMYFLFCLGVLTSDPTAVWEAPEGHTWLKTTREEALTLTAMPWVGKNDLRRIRKDVSYMIRSVTDPAGNQGDYADVDQLIGYYMREYVTLRQANIDKLYKAFIKIDQVHQGLYNYDEFKFLLPVPEDQPLAESIVSRAFYYAHTAGTNSFQISPHSFSAACVRFGIDNPCALAQVGWDLIFPFPLIKYIIDSKDEKYSGLIFKKEKVLAERTNYLKVPTKISTTVKVETQTNAIGLEKVAALLAQHYGVIRELKKYTEQLRQMIQQKDDPALIAIPIERLFEVLNSACEFFAFPIIF